MKTRNIIGAFGVGLLALATAACENKVTGRTVEPPAAKDKATKAVPIGSPLFIPEEVKAPVRPATPIASQVDPIVISGAQLTIPSTENVPTKNSGTIWQICTEIKPGQNIDAKDIFEHPTTKKKYRRLREGDQVNANDLVGMLDDQVARAKYNAAVTDQKAAEEMLVASNMVTEKSKNTLDLQKNLGPGQVSKLELYKAEGDWAVTVKQAAEAKGAREKAMESLNIAKVSLDDHELRTSISGVIKTIYVKPGEAVKEQSPVMLIENLSTLRGEGMMPIQYLPRLPNAQGKLAYLEPSAQLGPEQELIGHWSAVTCVAISKDARKPLIVSAGEDKFVRIWERATRFERAHVQAEAAIRAVACTGIKSQANLALFGGDDGVGQIIDLDKFGDNDVSRKLKTRHKARINAVAFTPDGVHCVTADNKEIFVHGSIDGELKYRFVTDHRGPITSIQVTPQAKLITVAQDKTMRVWDLGESGAKLNGVIDNRSGNVDTLGVSSDGQRVLFDQERALHVRGIFDARTEAIMNSPTDSSQFTSFAIFSPDNSLVVAAGTGDNPLGVWKLPAPGSNRAFQRVRLAIGNASATCAAISPDNNYIAVGTNDNRVLVFARPEKAELEKQFPASITYLGKSKESQENKVKIWVETPNTGMPLLPGDTITVVIPPQ